MDLINNVYGGWRYLMDELSDPRTNDWPLMSSPFPTIAISLTYAYFVKVSTCYYHRVRSASSQIIIMLQKINGKHTIQN